LIIFYWRKSFWSTSWCDSECFLFPVCVIIMLTISLWC